MSYIRAGSNPEGLYIYASDDGVWIHVGKKHFVVNEQDFINLIAGEPSGSLTCTFNGKKWVLKDGKKTIVKMWDVTWQVLVANNSHRALDK